MEQQHRVRNAFVLLLALVSLAGSSLADQNNSSSTANSPTAAAATENAQTSTTPATTIPTQSPAVNDASDPKTNASTKPIQIEVFYEALCKDSVDFFKDQLTPVYDAFNKFIDVTFIPFSQGTYNDTDNPPTIKCNRDGECDADCIHACGIEKISDKATLVKFLNCSLVEGFRNSTIPVQTCGKNSGIKDEVITSISSCAQDHNVVYPMLEKYSKSAAEAKVKFVPRIVINKVYSEDIQNLSLNNLKKVVCDKIPSKDLPSDCKTIVNGSDSVVAGLMPIIIGVYYFIRLF